jgi:hypothetical protein
MIFHDKTMPQVDVGGTHTFTKDSIKDRMYAVRAYLSPGLNILVVLTYSNIVL